MDGLQMSTREGGMNERSLKREDEEDDGKRRDEQKHEWTAGIQTEERAEKERHGEG